MITREYKCKECGKITGQTCSIKEPVLKECPHCKGELKQNWGNNEVLWFNNPHCGAISRRFL